MVIHATTTPASSASLTYHWKLSSGTIIGDQTGNSINVENDAVQDCEPPLSVHVQVDAEGLPKSCVSSASADFQLTTGICDIFPVDEYQATVFTNKEKPRFDNLAIQMANNPDRKAYVILEASSDASGKAVRLRVRKIREFILFRKYPMDRFVFLLRRSDRDRTIMWLPAIHGTMPECENCEAL